MLRQFLKTGIGGIVSQVAAVAALPVISRLYSQGDIGAWAVWYSVGVIVGSVASLRYEPAIVIAKDDSEAWALTWLCAVLAACWAVAVSVLLIWTPFANMAGASSGVPPGVIAMIVPLCLCLAFSQVLQSWCTRRGRFGLLAAAQIALVVTPLAVQIAGSALGGGVAWLAAGNLAGQFAAVLVALPVWRGGGIVRGNITEVARRFAKFPLFSAPYTLFGVIRDRAALLVLQAHITPPQLGQYSYAYRGLNLPVGLVSGIIRPVLFRACAADSVTAAEPVVHRLHLALACAATPFVVLFCFMPDQIVELVLGRGWAAAGEIGLWLIWPSFTFLFCNWLDRVLDVLGRQSLALGMEVAFSILSIGGMAAAFACGWGFRGALAAQSIMLTFYNLTYLVATYRASRWSLLSLARLAGVIAGVAVASVCLLVLARAFLPLWPAAVTFSVVAGCTGSMLVWKMVKCL